MKMRFFLNGPFKVVDDQGNDHTPTGARECALLALLLTSSHKRRARSWLQAKLWSSRGKKQAQDSLRTVLAHIRATFGEGQQILHANRRDVWLDETLIEIPQSDGEFLEGINVGDEEFEEWLVLERSAQDTTQERTRAHVRPIKHITRPLDVLPSAFAIKISVDRSTSAWWAERLVADIVGRTLSETFSIDVLDAEHAHASAVVWTIEIGGFSFDGSGFCIRIALVDEMGRRIWSDFRTIESIRNIAIDNAEVLQLSYELSEKIAFRILKAGEHLDSPDYLCRMGISLALSMRAEKMAEADSYFAQAFDLENRGIYLAWRAQLREMQFIQRTRMDRPHLQDECEEFWRRAMEEEPSNSTVLALLANSRLYIGRDSVGSLELARRSVRANNGNPLSWWALSASCMMSGNAKDAFQSARVMNRLTRNSPLSVWSFGQMAGASIMRGNLGEAHKLFKKALTINGHYRPAARYRVCLSAYEGDEEGTLEMAEHLKRIESDASISHILRDPTYQIALFRKDDVLFRSMRNNLSTFEAVGS